MAFDSLTAIGRLTISTPTQLGIASTVGSEQSQFPFPFLKTFHRQADVGRLRG